MLKISGYSDDLIEVEGDIVEEFEGESWPDSCRYIALSNGMVFSVRFGRDGWTIKSVAVGDSGSIEIITTENGDQEATIHDDITWVVAGSNLVKK